MATVSDQNDKPRGAVKRLMDPSFRNRCLIILAAVFVCAYGLGVLGYVLSLPEIGVRCAFTTVVNHFDRDFLVSPDGPSFERRDRIVAIAGQKTEDWPEILRVTRALGHLTPELVTDDPEQMQGHASLLLHGEKVVRVDYVRENGATGSVWVKVASPQLDTLVPTVLWFFIKGGLFLVGALVFWKRPTELQARMFFLFCVGSCVAYLGGYHWQSIVTSPLLLLVFMVSSVLLPPLSLHFYLVFPRCKPVYTRHPLATLVGLYGPSVVFLLFLLVSWLVLRWMVNSPGVEASRFLVRSLLRTMLNGIYLYFGVALILYLLSLWCLVHGVRTAPNALERNQVKWILFGAMAALAPMMYSLYLAVLERDRFGGGGATWPMFFASLFVTASFTISITRYRLMELDKIVSSSAGYVSASVLAALLYYGLVIVAVLVLGSRIIAEPTLAQGLSVAGTVLLLLVLLDLVRGQIHKVRDRHFRREKGQLDHTLQRMSEAIAQLVDPPTLAHRLLRSTTELLNVPRGAVYLRQGDPPLYRLADSLGEAPPLAELSSGCPLVEELRKQGRLCLSRSNGMGKQYEGGPPQRQLHFLGGEVALALSHDDQMLALLVLGPRGTSYSAEDLNLLLAFAQVTGLALVSSEGGRTIEVLNRELHAKVEKIAEQQRRILALQSQLRRKDEGGSDEVTPPRAAPAPSEPVEPAILQESPAPGAIVGSSPAVQQLLHLVRKVAGSSSSVLLRGESGTGKELLARAIHEGSPRADRPFVRVHCAALSMGLLESELFGHVRGAFTGAVRDRPGRFELAHGGTLFLDEIGDVSWEVQTKLLRVLQERTFERVGSSESVQVDVRIIAATHQNLERLIQQGRFREDLFYRLNVLPVQVPPLRQRREDIPELVQHFLTRTSQQCGKGALQIDDDALALLKAAPWPGNIRQLENVIERAVIIAEGPILTAEDLPPELLTAPLSEPLEAEEPGEAGPSELEGEEREVRERREREQLVRALAATNGNKAEAARLLGLKRSTLVSRLKKHGLS